MKSVMYWIVFLCVITAAPVLAHEQAVVIPLNSSGAASSGAAGSDGQVQYNNAGKTDGAKIYYDNTSGITRFESESDSSIIMSNNFSGPDKGLRLLLNNSGNAFIENTTTSGPSLRSMFIRNGTTGSDITISHNNYVGINETSPLQTLHIRQHNTDKAIRIENPTGNHWEIGATTTNKFGFFYNGINKGNIDQTSGEYSAASDLRLKKDLQYMNPVLAKVNQLKPAKYKFIDSAPDAQRTIGLVAQEVELVFPELVRELGGGYKGLVYNGFAVISIKAIQELSAQVNEMQLEIDRLNQILNKQL